MKWITTSGSGAISSAGTRGDDTVSISGTTVMFDTGKTLKTGGAAAYGNVAANANSYVIDTSRGLTVSRMPQMAYPRGYHNSVVLPDGKVVIIGGQTYLVGFADSDAVLPAEIWDPATGKFTTVAPISVPRNYHSIALLLPDGRVLSAGGGLCNCSADHPNYQIYTPPISSMRTAIWPADR